MTVNLEALKEMLKQALMSVNSNPTPQEIESALQEIDNVQIGTDGWIFYGGISYSLLEEE